MKKLILFVIAAAIAAGLIVIPSLLVDRSGGTPDGRPGSGRPSGPGAAANTVFAVRTVDAEIRSLQAYIEINGDIVSEQQVAVH
jgi:hypothetical protein